MHTAFVVTLAAVFVGLIKLVPQHAITNFLPTSFPSFTMRLPRQPLVPTHTDDVNTALIKPRIDTLQYRFVTLPNRLRCLLISDPDTEKAAAALDVKIGSMADPLELPGLAHFLEHMLFYASRKYPTEDEYSKFISEHGGHTNAYTASENTNYHCV